MELEPLRLTSRDDPHPAELLLGFASGGLVTVAVHPAVAEFSSLAGLGGPRAGDAIN